MSRRLSIIALLLVALAPVPSLLLRSAPATVGAADLFAAPTFGAIWAQADQPVASGQVQRTWLWGPAPITGGLPEPYAEAPDGQRLVQYFDKSRMEDNRWRAPDDPLWRVTNGLLVIEMVTGRLQLGDGQSEERQPARLNVAGDPGSGPTYADLTGLLSRPPLPDGAIISDRLLPGGQVVTGQPAPAEVRTGQLVPERQHTVADPFWTFMSGPGGVGGNPFFATGLPITEPYWTEVRVGGQPRWVLVQAFERRVLTFTPGNPEGFTVEMGNVGRHYYEWRYGQAPTPPAAPAKQADALQPAPLQVPPALQAAVEAGAGRRYLNRTVELPPGFSISLFALTGRSRFMAFNSDGVLHVAQPHDGRVVALPDRDRDGVADEEVVVAGGLESPHSLVFHGGGLYVGETNRVTRLEDTNGDLRADSTAVVVPDLPNRGQHWSRTVSFGPDGKLYVSIGSSCNVCLEEDWRRAAIVQYNADGSGGRLYAKGLRNSVGLAWQPGTGRLYATENGRDHMGDERPPEEINEIRDGGDYGWPRCHGGNIRDPRHGREPDACQGQVPPVVEMQAHSAPLGLTFVDTPNFPGSHQGDLIVAFHGSWNRSERTGYKLVRVPFADGQPTGEVYDFLTGFLRAGEVWSRPVGVTFGPDGALYVSDDLGGAIYRVTAGVSGP